MFIGGQRQLSHAQQHLGGVALRLGAGQTGIHRAVRQTLQKQAGKRAAAACHGASHVHQLLVQLLQQAGAVQQGDKALPLGLRHVVGAAVHGDALPHCHGGVGHDADDGIVAARHLPDTLDGQPRRHAQQHKGRGALLQRRRDLGQHIRHHLGLYAQQDVVALPGNGQVIRHRRADLIRQTGGLFRRPVGQYDAAAHLHRLGGGTGQRSAHISRSNESVGHKSPSFL